ncbi:MAG: helix-turn-helix domain-containing protein [Caulobacteraceae bacterium]
MQVITQTRRPSSPLWTTDVVNLAIGQNIREARKHRQLSQLGLGRLVNLSQQQIQKYEVGKDAVSSYVIVLLAEALDYQPSALLPMRKAITCNGAAVPLNEQQELLRLYERLSDSQRCSLISLVLSLGTSRPAVPRRLKGSALKRSAV